MIDTMIFYLLTLVIIVNMNLISDIFFMLTAREILYIACIGSRSNSISIAHFAQFNCDDALYFGVIGISFIFA
jgi:hypothetical protein